MKKYLCIWLLLFLPLLGWAQKAYAPLDFTDPVTFGGDHIIYQHERIVLGPKAFFVDGQLSDEEAGKWPFVFNSIQDAAAEVKDGSENSPMVLYIAPYVYWIDDPDDPEIRVPQDGRPVPYGMEIKCEWLRFFGLNKHPGNVILACNRGQTLGAKGNFTMFRFDGQGTSAENITFGNYCNVDLEFPLKPALNRTRRADAIVQAQLIHCNGDKIVARNTHFISRLNLCPFVGGKRVFFDQCHFESTDDALCGTAVYKNSSLDFYSSKPFYHTTGTGAVFLNCDIRSFTGGEQYFTKANGQIAVIDTRFKGPKMTALSWRDEPPASMKNYQHNVEVNNKPITISSNNPENTVILADKPLLNAYRIEISDDTLYNTYNLLKGDDNWDPEGIKESVKAAASSQMEDFTDIPVQLRISPPTNQLETKKDTAWLETSFFRFGNYPAATRPVQWQIPEEDKALVAITPYEDGNRVEIIPTNMTNTAQKVVLTAHTEAGLEAACELEILPAQLPPPRFSDLPKIHRTKDGYLSVDYSLKEGKLTDQSEISWYRSIDPNGTQAIKIAVSREGKPLRQYQLSASDIGRYITVGIAPKHLRSDAGPEERYSLKTPIEAADVKTDSHRLETDFSTLAVANQPEIIPGHWTFDTLQSSAYRPSFQPADAWIYGKGTGGSDGMVGLLQSARTGSMSYTPPMKMEADMVLNMVVSPHKTAGQGFSVAPLYMDVLIKYDAKTKTGYGLRIMRTTKFANSVDCFLIRYDHNQVTPLTEPVSTSCFRAPVYISLSVKENCLCATLSSGADYDPADYPVEVKDRVELSSNISPDPYGGFGLEYNGGSPTMINEVKLEWK
ncbi:hypothetical protein FKX85_06165 [Echinicola soli]|uniref:Uncharacterized protein n=1 Tax=Echinicola soli TaxID=2591634 RepID=A0A514CFV5_9BACT|nr:hypothetical protein [Echinicola soli]QDH78640.1 hypothetical protein FKX85_06165 [Echinicola soli]